MLLVLLSLAENEDDRAKITYIFENYFSFMFKVAFSVLKNKPDSDEAVSDALFFLMHTINDIDISDKKKLKSYLFTVTEKRAMRLQGKLRGSKLDFEPDMDIFPVLDNDPENSLVLSDLDEKLVRIIAELPCPYVEVLKCRFVLGLSVKKTSELLGRKQSTVRTQIRRALKLFQQKIAKENCNE